MARAVTRLTSKLEAKLADKDFYEAHQLYRTIYFRLERDIKYNQILSVEDDSKEPWNKLLANRVEFIEKNESFPFVLEFLGNGVESLLKVKELISGMDLLKMFQQQLGKVVFEAQVKPGSEAMEFYLPEFSSARDTYYAFLQRWFDRMMDLTQLYCDTGLEMIQNKAAQSKGFQENDFLSERDQLIYKNLEFSKALRLVSGESEAELNIRNATIRSNGQPAMHLRHGKLLMRFGDFTKARQCFIYAQDSFELAKFLYFYQKTLHNESEYELVLVKTLIKTFNVQLFLNAKPGAYYGNRKEKFMKLNIKRFSDEEMATTKVRALVFAKEVLTFYLAITRFSMLRDEKHAKEHTTKFFRNLFLIKYLNFLLILMEELLRQEDIVPAESAYHFNTNLVMQMRKSFRFQDETCFASEKETARFLNFFGNREDYAESLSKELNGDGKQYILRLFFELRTEVYEETIKYHRKMDRELDVDLLDRIFFVYFNDKVDPRGSEIPEDLLSPGYFEPAQTRQQQAPPNLFSMLLGGMAGGSGTGGAGGGAGPDGANFMSFLNDFMQ